MARERSLQSSVEAIESKPFCDRNVSADYISETGEALPRSSTAICAEQHVVLAYSSYSCRLTRSS